MKHTPARILMRKLIGENKLNEPQADAVWPGYVGYMPPEDERCAVISDTSPEPIADLLRAPRLQWEGVQLMVRDGKAGYETGWEKIKGLDKYIQESLQGDFAVEFIDQVYTVHQVRLDSGPMFIGREEQTERVLFTANYLIHLSIV
jgi:hypothetical protein